MSGRPPLRLAQATTIFINGEALSTLTEGPAWKKLQASLIDSVVFFCLVWGSESCLLRLKQDLGSF